MTAVRLVLRVLFGLANAASAGFFLYLELHKAPADKTLALAFLCWIALGIAIAAPGLVFGAVQKILALVKPFLPRVTIGKPPEA